MRYLPFLALAAGAQALVDLPQVSAFVQQALTAGNFENYTSATAPAIQPAATPTVDFRIESDIHAQDVGYWMKDIAKQGRSAFNSNPSGYKVWRNVVADYGAKGDGVTDDTAAINRAISDGGRCGPGNCQSSTVSPAVVYFPAGTYVVSQSIIQYYNTMMIGNPNSLPVLKATSNFQGLGVIDANPYQSGGAQGWTSTNVFFRQIRNFIIDLTPVPAATAATGIHWAVSQATSLQNIQIKMTKASNSQQQGIFIENGSGGWMNDLTITGGLYGLNVGNQQFSVRGVTIDGAITGVSQIWSWGFTYQQMKISNCQTAFDIANGGSTNQNVGSVNIIDSTITNCPTFVNTAWTSSSSPPSAGSLNIENVALSNVGVGVKSPNGNVLGGGSTTIGGWKQGHQYTPTGPQNTQGSFTPASRSTGLLGSGNNYYFKSKPFYASNPVSDFVSIRSAGAKGDGSTDDSTAIQNAINSAASNNKIVYFDQGTYKVTKTITFPPNTRVVGEAFPVIMATGSYFNDVNNPKAVVQVGTSGQSGTIEWSDMILSTQGTTAGAKMIEWNLNAARGSGMWDVHTRIGGFAGSNQSVGNCPKNAGVNKNCMAAYMSMHITSSAKGAYIENSWLWTADHDLDEGQSTQITIYTGRGLLIEGGNTWLYGSGVEHHALYQYNIVNTADVFSTFLQTETPYWQPNPDVRNQPFPFNNNQDPNYSNCQSGNCDALGLRINNAKNLFFYGAGFYSFFNNYSTTCSNNPGNSDCQSQMVLIEGPSTNIRVYALSTIGSQSMIVRNGQSIARYSDNENVFPETIGYFAV
ncbi:exo-beta 1,3 glucanase-like protein [Pseudovirgaria hyperparasitica]|uniref:Exo-beta 1,3 glucanase-like protein n=1 Tax=Pseudovirgaria hyperparasitica TaxID=470096 RepID=A0A6A6WM07_9PEZI|nr:exo-beta 1,3 glucanase-like protein [Pseudovirgaria hyperparasitica]KAF2763234.1 exo-beta 1,3 glucanase-like protein [Pseudovirgaria hyperparasitica]